MFQREIAVRLCFSAVDASSHLAKFLTVQNEAQQLIDGPMGPSMRNRVDEKCRKTRTGNDFRAFCLKYDLQKKRQVSKNIFNLNYAQGMVLADQYLLFVYSVEGLPLAGRRHILAVRGVRQVAPLSRSSPPYKADSQEHPNSAAEER